MTQQLLDREAIDRAEADLRLLGDRVEKPYATPLVVSFALDPHDADTGDALTANG